MYRVCLNLNDISKNRCCESTPVQALVLSKLLISPLSVGKNILRDESEMFDIFQNSKKQNTFMSYILF